MKRVNVLFVCSRNRWRSPTAEKVYQDDDRLSVRSRGTTRNAAQTVTSKDIQWSDLILVMEDKHCKRILADFPGESKFTPMEVLDIPDDYQYMDSELIDLIRLSVESVLAIGIHSQQHEE